ncbi:hypothetical protein CROQUDRAFT_717520 [Cronartium quercuum f. sp. fusiforme G11]|uniref:Uncharacterized protein n=1 Tax=Cronartium quercuum f. sp. fusiforme G11 TaxID=708437 RepID=A0A9P6NEW2_9BASI|nr:hypothetical protein CROQUDRAFT_717520 [Cronartium quercuum f. sp. fusiforme G11]
MALSHSVFLLDHSLHRFHSPSKLFIRKLKMTCLFCIVLQLLFCTRIACFDWTFPATRGLEHKIWHAQPPPISQILPAEIPELHDTTTELNTGVTGTGDSKVDEKNAGTENLGSGSNAELHGRESKATQADKAMNRRIAQSVSGPTTQENFLVFDGKIENKEKPLPSSPSAVGKDVSQEAVVLKSTEKFKNLGLAGAEMQETLQGEASELAKSGEASHLQSHSVSKNRGKTDPGKIGNMEDKGAIAKFTGEKSRGKKKKNKKGSQAVKAILVRGQKVQLDSSLQPGNPTEAILFHILQKNNHQKGMSVRLSDKDFEAIFMRQVEVSTNPELALHKSEWSDALQKFTKHFPRPHEGARRIAALTSIYGEMSLPRRWQVQEAARLGQPVNGAGKMLSAAARDLALALRVQEEWPVFYGVEFEKYEAAFHMLENLSAEDNTDLENFFSRNLYHARFGEFYMMADLKEHFGFISEDRLIALKKAGGNASVLLHIGGLLELASPRVKWKALENKQIEFKIRALRWAMEGKLYYSLEDHRVLVVDKVSWFDSPTRKFIDRSDFFNLFKRRLKLLAQIADSRFSSSPLKYWIDTAERYESWENELISPGEVLRSAHFSISPETLGAFKSLYGITETIGAKVFQQPRFIRWLDLKQDPRFHEVSQSFEQLKAFLLPYNYILQKNPSLKKQKPKFRSGEKLGRTNLS